MTVEECNTALYEKLFESQEKLRGWLLSQPPEEILNYAYEYTMRVDILLSLEYNDLTARQAQALLALDDPLDELFHHMEQRESGQMEFVLRCMEEKGDELIAAEDAATSQIPVYLQSAAHAVEHGELAEYRASLDANIACKDALETALHTHYKDNALDTDSAVRETLGQFGAQRVQTILAMTVQRKEWDGRISPANKAWARTIPVPAMGQQDGQPILTQAHPGLINLFLNRLRKELEPQQKSLHQRLQAIQPAKDSPKAARKFQEPER